MAELQYSKKDQGFHLSTRKELDLGWTYLDEGGNVVGRVHRFDLTNFEAVLVNHRKHNPSKRQLSRRRIRRRLRDITGARK